MEHGSTLKEICRKIKPILKRHDVVKAGIFGSYARGEVKKKSDIDILIQYKGNKSLLDISGLKIELEDALKKRVDLVTYKYIHPPLKERILKEEVRVL